MSTLPDLPSLSSALERLTRFFEARPSRQGWLARRWLGCPHPDDEALRDRLVEQVSHGLRSDGSLGGATLPTIWTALELVDLAPKADVLERLVVWVMSLQGRPGAFSEGCTAARHPHKVCEHFLGGFFSPAPPAQRVAPITLPNGKLYRNEPQARFALSCLALRLALLTGRAREPLVERHLESMTHLQGEWAAWGAYLAPDLAFAALTAFAAAPPRWSGLTEALVGIVHRNQAADGNWPQADFFNALDALSLPGTAGRAALPALERALPALLARQRDDGSFGHLAQDERALVALRVLLRVREGDPSKRL